MKQLRAAIGRQLRLHYDATAEPVPVRLTELMAKLDQSEAEREKAPWRAVETALPSARR